MNATQTLHQATLAKWTAVFQEQKDSGLTIKEWCSQNDVSLHSFYYWKHIAKEEYLKSVMPEIVPLSIPSDPVPSPVAVIPAPAPELELYNLANSNNSSPSVSDPVPISISMGDIRIEIGSSAPESLISAIIGALRNA